MQTKPYYLAGFFFRERSHHSRSGAPSTERLLSSFTSYRGHVLLYPSLFYGLNRWTFLSLIKASFSLSFLLGVNPLWTQGGPWELQPPAPRGGKSVGRV